jgi:hypothetical protein
VPVQEVTQLLIAPLLFMTLHRNSVGACRVGGPDLDPLRLIDTQIDLVLHGLLATTQAKPRRRHS